MRILNACLLSSVLIIMLSCGGKVSVENLGKIHDGMTYQDVVEIIGKPTDEFTATIPGVGEAHSWKKGDLGVTIYFSNNIVVQMKPLI